MPETEFNACAYVVLSFWLSMTERYGANDLRRPERISPAIIR